jgi:hypothetical protein
VTTFIYIDVVYGSGNKNADSCIQKQIGIKVGVMATFVYYILMIGTAKEYGTGCCGGCHGTGCCGGYIDIFIVFLFEDIYI